MCRKVESHARDERALERDLPQMWTACDHLVDTQAEEAEIPFQLHNDQIANVQAFEKKAAKLKKRLCTVLERVWTENATVRI